MNFSRHFVPLIATVALLLALWAAIQLWQLRHHLDQQTEALLEPEVELAVYMQQLHHYAQKLHWSGTAGNQQLASFYLHELEETEEKVLEAPAPEPHPKANAACGSAEGPARLCPPLPGPAHRLQQLPPRSQTRFYPGAGAHARGLQWPGV
jgi:hypothetical protein